MLRDAIELIILWAGFFSLVDLISGAKTVGAKTYGAKTFPPFLYFLNTNDRALCNNQQTQTPPTRAGEGFGQRIACAYFTAKFLLIQYLETERKNQWGNVPPFHYIGVSNLSFSSAASGLKPSTTWADGGFMQEAYMGSGTSPGECQRNLGKSP